MSKNDDDDGDDGDDGGGDGDDVKSTSDTLRVTLTRQQYDALPNASALNLYYKEMLDQTVQFDEDGDTQLLDLHRGDIADFTRIVDGQRLYEALVTRAAYHCKLHPQVDAMKVYVANELAGSVDTHSLIVFVYERDNARRSDVKARRQIPFTNGENGVGTGKEASVVLFTRYSIEPRLRGKLVWFREPRRNSTLGSVAFLVEESY